MYSSTDVSITELVCPNVCVDTAPDSLHMNKLDQMRWTDQGDFLDTGRYIVYQNRFTVIKKYKIYLESEHKFLEKFKLEFCQLWSHN